MILAVAAALAIVVQDHAPLRAAAQSGATELTTLWQGDVLEVRGERAGYLQVYNYRRERGGYLRSDLVRPLGLTESDAPQLLAVLRFLSDSRGSEALGISYGAAYLKAVAPKALTAEALEDIARMAERLADAASGTVNTGADVGAHLDVVSQFGIHMRSFERNGRMQVCYDGTLFHQLLALTRADCIDPTLGPTAHTALDLERGALLEAVPERDLTPLTRSQLHARRAALWAAIAFARARHGESPALAGQRALTEFLGVEIKDLGEDRRAEYSDTAIRVNASRWAAELTPRQPVRLTMSSAPDAPGQTCVVLHDAQGGQPLVQRCTYGIVWMASAQIIAQGQAAVLAVQPLESWSELWIIHRRGGNWIVDVLPPGTGEPDAGYIEYAGFAPDTRHLLVAREIRDHGRIRRTFEELRLDDLAVVRFASRPDLLRDFNRWQDPRWQGESLALR